MEVLGSINNDTTENPKVRSNGASNDSISDRSTSFPQETSSNSSKGSVSPSKSICSSSSTSSENVPGIEMKVRMTIYCYHFWGMIPI